MPRARSLKPDFFKDAELVECPFWVRLLFAGLWTVADRDGRLDDRAKQIKIDVFPADDVDVEAGLAELAERGFIVRYEAAGKRLIQIKSFARHQNPHKNEPPSTRPAPGEQGAGADPAPAANVAPPVTAPEGHGAGTVQAPDISAANRADSGLRTPVTGLRTADSRDPDSGAATGRAAARPPASAAFALFQAMCEELDIAEADAAKGWKQKQIGIAAQVAADGFGEGDVRAFLAFTRTDPYWQGKPLDMAVVKARIGTWAANKRPAAVPANGRASPGRRSAADRLDAESAEFRRLMAAEQGIHENVIEARGSVR